MLWDGFAAGTVFFLLAKLDNCRCCPETAWPRGTVPVGAGVEVLLDPAELPEVAWTSPEPDALGGCGFGLVPVGRLRLGRFGL
jgi:hypothetical protein